MSVSNHQARLCSEHNQPLLLVDPNTKKSVCIVCIQNLTGLHSADQLKKKKEELIKQLIKESETEKLLLENSRESIIAKKNIIVLAFDKIIGMTNNQIQMTESLTNKLQQEIQSQDNQQQTIEIIKQECQNQLKNNREVRNQVEQQLQDMFNQQSNENKIQIINENQNILKRFEYKQILEFTKEEVAKCFLFSLNREQQLIAIACETGVRINKFVNGQITQELLKFSDEVNLITGLFFMKQSDSFVISFNNQISIFDLKLTGLLKTQLNGSQEIIISILLNKKENCLISSSLDQTLKFWNKIDNKWSCLQTLDVQNEIYCLSLNEQDNKLITCGEQPKIQVLDLQNDNKWIIVQTIQVCEQGYRLCFTIENQFVFQPKTKDFLEIYGYEKEQNKFQKLKDVKVQSCQTCDLYFPCQYIKQKKILTVKHGQFLNIFIIDDEGNYQLLQTIQFEVSSFFGNLSDNGKYLITWDSKSQQIQVRKLKGIK